MASQINVSNINGNFPQSGKDNPSQGLRDNFTNIKLALVTATTEITELQLTRAKLNDTNDFGFIDGSIQRAVVKNSGYTADNNAATDGTIDYRYASYHKSAITTDTTFVVSNWPSSGIYSQVRLEIAPVDSELHQIAFGVGAGTGTVHMVNGVSLPYISTSTESTIWDIWTTDGGSNVFVEFLNSSGGGVYEGGLGYDGSIGYSGSRGYTGYRGSGGYTGSSGARGYSGSAGYIGSSGSGYVGSKGYVGSRGIGYTGSAGFAGSMGDQGDIGYVGSQGAGYVGSQGIIGYAGSRGSIGYYGSVGYIGSSGAAAAVGYTGSAGLGYTGSSGVGYTGSSGAAAAVGYTGSQGTTGYVGSGGIGLTSRTSVSTTTSVLSSGTSATTIISGFKGYALYSIQTSYAAWVTVYNSTASRTADNSREITTDPTPGSGVIAEVITTSSQTQYFTPAVIGYNSENVPITDIPVKIYNNGTGSSTITVTMTILQLEN